MSEYTTLNDWREPALICCERGWTVGTILVGDEGYGPEEIVITAIGECEVLARVVNRPRTEASWCLSHRDWKVKP